MAIKYECPKCGRKFVDWGAKKLDFKCPDCVEEALVRVSASEKPHRAPSLKRAASKAAVSVSPSMLDDEEEVATDLDDVVDDEAEAEVEEFAEEDEVEGGIHEKRAPHAVETVVDDVAVDFEEPADEDEQEADADVDEPVDLGFGDAIGTSLGEAVPEPDLDDSFD